MAPIAAGDRRFYARTFTAGDIRAFADVSGDHGRWSRPLPYSEFEVRCFNQGGKDVLRDRITGVILDA